MPNNLTQAAFGKAVGLSQGRVSELVGEGLPTNGAGRIDLDEGRAWIAANIDPDRRRGGGREPGTARPALVPAPDGGVHQTVAGLRGAKLVRESKLLDIELRRKSGELVDRAEAERAI